MLCCLSCCVLCAFRVGMIWCVCGGWCCVRFVCVIIVSCLCACVCIGVVYVVACVVLLWCCSFCACDVVVYVFVFAFVWWWCLVRFEVVLVGVRCVLLCDIVRLCHVRLCDCV